MSERLKRILFIGFFVLFTAAVGVSIYYVFFRGAPEAEVPTEEALEPGALPSAGEAEPHVPEEPVIPGALPTAPGVPTAAVTPGVVEAEPQTVLMKEGVTQQISRSSDGLGARYYDPIESKFYRITPEGLSEPLSDEQFPNVEEVSWGNESDQAIITFPDGSKIHYDFNTEKQTTLPKHWNEFDFSTDDQGVVAKSEAVAPESRYLIITNPDGSNARAIEPLGTNDDKTFPHWTPNNQIIAYATVGEASAFNRQQILMVGKNHENFTALQVEGRGFQPLWSPSGQKILYSVWNTDSDYKPVLWISGGAPENINRNRMNLGLQTWANKCAWSGDETVYCGVPENLPRGAGLQPELFTDLTDTIYKIDLRSGATFPLGSPEGNLSVSEPTVTSDGKNFIFRDSLTGELYSFRLF